MCLFKLILCNWMLRIFSFVLRSVSSVNEVSGVWQKRALAIARALFVSRKSLARRVVSKKAYAGEKEKSLSAAAFRLLWWGQQDSNL